MTRFLLPDPVRLDEAMSLLSLVSKIQLLSPQQKILIALRLGLSPDEWETVASLGDHVWARGTVNSCQDKLFAARCRCSPCYRILPTAWSNPPEGFCVDATIRYAKIKVCAQLYPHDSIEAQSADWDLWLPADFCQNLLKRRPTQREVDRVCDAIVERALNKGVSFIRKAFINAVKEVLPYAEAKQVDDYRSRHSGPWKAGSGAPRK